MQFLLLLLFLMIIYIIWTSWGSSSHNKQKQEEKKSHLFVGTSYFSAELGHVRVYRWFCCQWLHSCVAAQERDRDTISAPASCDECNFIFRSLLSYMAFKYIISRAVMRWYTLHTHSSYFVSSVFITFVFCLHSACRSICAFYAFAFI